MEETEKQEQGQGLVEYLILVALIAIGSIAIVRTLGHTIYVRFSNITNALQNKDTDLQPTVVTAEQYQKRGLNDFFKAAANDGTK